MMQQMQQQYPPRFPMGFNSPCRRCPQSAQPPMQHPVQQPCPAKVPCTATALPQTGPGQWIFPPLLLAAAVFVVRCLRPADHFRCNGSIIEMLNSSSDLPRSQAESIVSETASWPPPPHQVQAQPQPRRYGSRRPPSRINPIRQTSACPHNLSLDKRIQASLRRPTVRKSVASSGSVRRIPWRPRRRSSPAALLQSTRSAARCSVTTDSIQGGYPPSNVSGVNYAMGQMNLGSQQSQQQQ